MSTATEPLSNNNRAPLSRVSLNSPLTNLILDSDTSNSSFLFVTNALPALYIDKYQNIGINTISPTHQLSINSSNGACLRLIYNNTNNHATLSVDVDGRLVLTSSGLEIFIPNTTNLNIKSHNGTTSGLKLNDTLVTSSATQLNYVNVVPGTVTASKALVVDSNRDLSTLRNIISDGTISSVGINSTGIVDITNTSASTSTTTGALKVSGGVGIVGTANVGGNLNVTGTITGTINGTLSSALQQNITTLGTLTGLTSNGNVNVASHDGSTTGLQLNGVLVTATASELNYVDVVAGVASASKALVLNASSNITGINSLSATTLVGTLGTASQPNITSLGTITGLTSSGTVNITDTTASSSISTGALRVSGGVGITGATYIGGILNVVGNITGTLATDSQPNITSLGTLTGLTSSGIINITDTTTSSSTSTGALRVNGGVGIAGATYIGGILNVTGNITGTLATASQPNITSLGTLTGLTSSGIINITDTTTSSSTSTGALRVSGGVGISGATYIGGILNVSGNITGTLATASQPNITSLGTLTGLTSSGVINITDSTASSSTSTGALKISGGISISNTTDATSNTNGGTFTSAGGGAFAKSLYIGQNLTVGGNLTISGTTTTINSTTTNIKDNTLILNSGPAGTGYDSGTLTQRYQIANDSGTGDVVNDTPKENYTLTAASSNTITLPSSANGTDNYYNNWWIKITSAGAVSNQVRQIIGYIGATKVATLGTAFTTIPVNPNTVSLYNKSYSALLWQESNKQFIIGYSSNDTSSGALTIIDYADLTLNQLNTSSISSSGIVTITNTTSSTSTSTGALKVSGGVGIGGSTYIGGILDVAGNITGTLATASQPNITSLGTLTGLTSSGAVNVTDSTASSSTSTGALRVSGGVGIVGATYIGGVLNVSGNITGTLATASQPNITSLGTLTGLTSSGGVNITDSTASSSTTTGALRVSGGVGIVGATYIGGVLNVSGNITGTLATASQPNITSLGTLTGLTSSGGVNITDSTVSSSTTTGALRVSGGVGIGGALNVGGVITGTLATASQPNITSLGTLIGLTSSGVVNITDSTVSSSTSTGALRVSGGVGITGATYIGGALNVSGNITGTLATASQPNITSLGTLTGLTSNGVVNITDATVSSSTTTGAFWVSGGVGIGGALNVGGTIIGTIGTASQPNITSLGTLTSLSTGSITLNGTLITASAADINSVTGNAGAQSSYISGITEGVAAASKAVVLDSSLSISGIRRINFSGNRNVSTDSDYRNIDVFGTTYTNTFSLANSTDSTHRVTNFIGRPTITATNTGVTTTTLSTFYIDGNPITGTNMSITNAYSLFIANSGTAYIDGGLIVQGHNGSTTGLQLGNTLVTATATQINTLSGVTAGTASASKALVLDASSNISGINSLSATTLVGTLGTASQTNITAVGTLTGLTSSGSVNITDSTTSSSASTGALRITGGVGIGGALNTSSSITSTFAGFGLTHTDGTISLRSWINNASQAGIASFGVTTNHQLRIVTNNSSRIEITSAGRVGIATSVPDRQLEINASDGNCLRLTYNDSNGSATTYADQTISSTGSVTLTAVGSSPEIILAGGSVTVSSSTASSSTTTGGLLLAGGIGISNTTDSTSSTNGGTFTSAGGGAFAKSLFVGQNLTVGGNLTISGTTTTINSTTTNIKDNIIILNSGPAGTGYDSGLLTQRFQNANDAGTGDVVNDSAEETYALLAVSSNTITLPSGANANNNYYNNWWIKIISGPGNNQVRQITSYVGSTRVATLATAFTTNPSISNTVNLYNKTHGSFVWQEASKRFCTAFTTSDSIGSSLTIIDYADFASNRLLSLDTTASTSNTTGSLLVSGGVGISNSTDATSSANGGTFTSAGGGAFAKSLYVGGSLNVTGNITGTLNTASQTGITTLGTLTGLSINSTGAPLYLESTNSTALTTSSAVNAYDVCIKRSISTNGLSSGIGFLMSTNSASSTPAGGAIIFTRVNGPSVGNLSFYTSNTSLSERMRIMYTGRIGMGTSNPDRQLEINASDGNCLRLTYNDDNGSATNYVDLSVNSSGKLNINTVSGNIGFNKSDPKGYLDFGSRASNTSILIYNDETVAYGFGAQDYAVKYFSGGGNGHCWFTNSTLAAPVSNEKMRLTGDGNLGIGTTSPDRQLEINASDGNCLRLTYNDNNGSATSYTDLSVTSGGVLYMRPSGGTTFIGNASAGGNLIIGQDIGTGNAGYVRIIYDGANSTQYLQVGQNGSSGSACDFFIGNVLNTTTESTRKIMFKAGGRVGIGTTEPDRPLEINASDGNCLRLTYNDNNGSAINYTDLGAGPDGTFNILPSNKNVIMGSNSDANAALFLGANTSTATKGLFKIGVYDGVGFINTGLNSTTGSSMDLVFTNMSNSITDSTKKIIFKSDGKVGLGTSAPSRPLEINSSDGNNLRLSYGALTGSATNYVDFSTSSSGQITISPSSNNATSSSGDILLRGSVIIGKDASNNLIRFNGTTGDGNPQHTVIGERIYSSIENAELILFKGNDIPGGSGPDRIRHRAAQHLFQTYTSAEDYAALADNNTRLIIMNDGKVGINTTGPDRQLEINSSTGDCLRLSYNDSDGGAGSYSDVGVDPDGTLCLVPSNRNVLIGNSTDNNFLLFIGANTSTATKGFMRIGVVDGVGYFNTGLNTTIGSAMDLVFTNTGQTISQSSKKVIIKADGKFGIGTSAPDRQLEINASDGNCLRLTNNDSDGSAANFTDFRTTSNGNLYIDASGGNVFIGNNTSAAESLFIGSDNTVNTNGCLRICNYGGTNYIQSGASISTGSNADLFIGNMWNDTASSARKIMFKSDGKVGFGTVSPSGLLDFGTNASNNTILLYNNGTNAYGFGAQDLALKYLTSGTNGHIWYTGSGLDTNFGTERMRLMPSGNLGIGTNSPSYKLDVNGSCRVSGSIWTTGCEIYNADMNSAGGSTSGYGLHHSGTGTDSVLHRLVSQGYVVNAQSPFQFQFGTVTNTSLEFMTNNVARMFLDTSGNVGIGYTNGSWGSSGSYKLDVNGTTKVSRLLVGTSTDTSRMISALDSSQATTTVKYITLGRDNSLGNQAEIGFYYAGSSSTSNRLDLGFHGGPAMSILYGGNVGIGTTSPGSKLSVNGSLSKSSGTFDIKHPKIENKRLVHSFVEGPRCDLIYRGQVQLMNGKAIVNLDKDCVSTPECAMSDGTFVSLVQNPMCYLQNSTFDRVIGTIENNLLTIICENNQSNSTVNWMVVGERKDPYIKEWERTNSNGCLITEY